MVNINFYDSFESFIDHSSGPSNFDKFDYLNSFWEATETISGLKLIATNNGEAISILKK